MTITRIKTVLLTLCLCMVCSIANSQETPRNGCEILNADFAGGYYISLWWIIPLQFYAGETIVVSAEPPDSVASTVSLVFDFTGNHTVVDSTSFPGTVSYRFDNDEVIHELGWEVDLGGATWTASCVKPAAPIPVIDRWGLTMLILLLVAWTIFRRREFFAS